MAAAFVYEGEHGPVRVGTAERPCGFHFEPPPGCSGEQLCADPDLLRYLGYTLDELVRELRDHP